MELTKEIFGVWILFRLKGRLDVNTAPELDRELLPEIEKRLDIAFDFSELDYISSMGIRSIMRAANKTRELNHRVAVCGMRPEVKTVLSDTGVTAFLDIYDDVKDMPFAADIIVSRKN